MENKNVFQFSNGNYRHSVRVLGDPHLGRRFKTGVPLHSLGQRELSVWESFESSLYSNDNDMHICMGDIFDKYTVPAEVLLRCFQTYVKASEMYPLKKFFIIQGNHDLSRDEDKASSLDVLEQLLANFSNVIVVKTPMIVQTGPASTVRFLLIPYHAHKQGAEVIMEACQLIEDDANPDKCVEAAFGHWDIDTFGGTRPHNLIDTGVLGQYTDTIITGHVHQPEVRKIPHPAGELTLIVTGSMQPYSFAEDLTGDLYITSSLEDVLKMSAASLKGKCVRVLLKAGEEMPEIDCLQLVPKFVNEEGEDSDDIEVELIDFNMMKLLNESLLEAEVGVEVSEEVRQIYTAIREGGQ
jgi:DNA repair exonuclease SbcCD nuclease subunit